MGRLGVHFGMSEARPVVQRQDVRPRKVQMIEGVVASLVLVGFGFVIALVTRRPGHGGQPQDRSSTLSAAELAELDRNWMAYITAEVHSACEKKGWRDQIRRKWSVRDKPVSQSMVGDYEWKLVLDISEDIPQPQPNGFDEGIYYVLSFDIHRGRFVFQHDTARCGSSGPHWALASFTHIELGAGDYAYCERLLQVGAGPEGPYIVLPEDGWLQDVLIDLTSRFNPNQFSYT